jgi:radical SAM protein with 4Fe4S-binding SPASM domain
MANISITRRCERDCDFCFAADERKLEPLDMTSDVYEAALDFLKRSDVPDARLLGGEPTLHPDFPAFADRALGHGFALTVMTGGMMPLASLDYLASVPAKHASVYLNAAVPGVDSDGLVAAQQRLCMRLGERVELGLTLVSSHVDPGFLLEWIEGYGLTRRVRLGVAHPILGGANTSASAATVRTLGRVVERFVESAGAEGVEVGFDCGLTPCMFSVSFAAQHPEIIDSVGMRCGPIIDILPEGDTVACYALARTVRVPLGDEDTRAGLLATFDEHLERLLPASGTYEECGTCAHRIAGRCAGGCRARAAMMADGGGPCAG